MKQFFAALVIIFWGAGARAEGGELRLTLGEAIRSAVERNLDVKAELFNPAIAEADVRRNQGIYNTKLSLFTNFDYSVTESPNFIVAGAQLSRRRQLQLNPGVSQLVPLGGTVGLTFNNTYNKNNAQQSGFLTEYWQSDLTVSLSQPLLKNFGREPTEFNIMVARNGKEGSLERFRTRLTDTVVRVRIEYYRLYSLREDLEVRRTSLELARKILTDTQARVKAGVLPAMEILNAEFGVASREKDLLDAEKAVRDQNDVLRLLLQIPTRDEIVPVDLPSKTPLAVREEELIRRALDIRPELSEQRVNLRTNELEARVNRNRTLPDLNLTASAAVTGLDRRYNRDLEKVGGADFPVWSVGLTFEYPLGNDAAENDFIRSRLRVDQTKTQIRSLEASVENEVKIAVRGVDTSFKQIDVTDRGKAFAEERLRSFIRRNEVGLATTRDVLDVENELAVARSNQTAALVGYNNAITELWRSTGDILDQVGVKVSDKEGDALYESMR